MNQFNAIDNLTSLDIFMQASESLRDQGTKGLLLNEAFSSYVVFIAGIVAGIVGWLVVNYLSRKKPQIIEVLRKESVSMLEIDSQIRDDIKVEYKGKAIGRLHRTSFDILNRGETPVTDFNLSINTQSINLEHTTLGLLLVDPGGREVQDASVSISNKDISVSIRFLNPFIFYRDRLTLFVFSADPLEVTDARGRGLGWGVAYFDQLGYEKELSGILVTSLTRDPVLNELTRIIKSLMVVISRSMVK
jgi:hypothetical protein